MQDTLALALDRDGHRPLYLQISEEFRRRIKSRLWPAGFQLPASEVIAADLRVARGTVRRAIQELADEGLLVQVHGRGTFVAAGEATADVVDRPTEVRISSGERLAREGVWFRTEVLDRTRLVSARIGPFAGGVVLRVRRLRTLSEGPDAILTTELLVDAIPEVEQLTDHDLVEGPLRTVLRDRFGVVVARGERMYSAVLADDETASVLDVPVGSPLLSFEEFVFDEQGRCFEHSLALVRTDRHPVAVDV